MHSSFLYAYISGLVIALSSGPIGSILVWRRISFISDAITHSMILGIVISHIFSINNLVIMILFAFSISLLVSYIQKIKWIKIDIALSIITSSSIAIGMMIKELMNISIDIHSIMFGDILSLSQNSTMQVFGISSLIIILMMVFWNQIVKVSLDKDIAISIGINIYFIDFIIIFIISMFSILAVKSVGILLAGALLVIPASIARLYSNTPKSMAVLASVISVICMMLGLYISISFDMIPSVVISITSVLFFIVAMF